MSAAAQRRIFHLRRGMVTLFLFASGVGPARAASEIKGRVSDQTRAAPASGDEVILLRLDNAMQEEARTKTDAAGDFRIAMRQPDERVALSSVTALVHGLT